MHMPELSDVDILNMFGKICDDYSIYCEGASCVGCAFRTERLASSEENKEILVAFKALRKVVNGSSGGEL